VSSITPKLIRNCQRCSRELAPGALACDQCHALVHSEKLDQLAAEAKALEARGDLRQARERWLMGMPLLPPNSRQADWIQQHVRALDSVASRTQTPPPSENPWTKKLGPVGPIALLLAKGKFLLTALFKLKFLLSFAAFIGLYWAAFGMKFGVGFAVLILLHEMGHFIDIKRRGLPAEMPVFLPGLGAYVRWQALGVPLETRAAISLAGRGSEFAEPDSDLGARWRAGGSGAEQDGAHHSPNSESRSVAAAGPEHVFPSGARRGISSLLWRKSSRAA
jgi:hypothetical protein